MGDNFGKYHTTPHYWKSKWNGEGQFICEVCGMVPLKCKGKQRIMKHNE